MLTQHKMPRHNCCGSHLWCQHLTIWYTVDNSCSLPSYFRSKLCKAPMLNYSDQETHIFLFSSTFAPQLLTLLSLSVFSAKTLCSSVFRSKTNPKRISYNIIYIYNIDHWTVQELSPLNLGPWSVQSLKSHSYTLAFFICGFQILIVFFKICAYLLTSSWSVSQLQSCLFFFLRKKKEKNCSSLFTLV